ncbi:hypothetical protein TrLO_g13559 [Triparma laevis f. longispina]|uniref:Thioredoxin domain-containing protein n=2 Tax=Triparma laevis TaxID=1534972 RepID=A0A9W7C7U0_9STRA|nr:hypothetical protein TrLO_g13559 [Triparma laevis f. longispina]
MPPAAVNPSVVLTDDEHFDACLAKSNDLLLLIDVHQDWSGPCETLTPTFSRLMMDTEKADSRLLFLSAEIPKFASKVQELASDDAKLGDMSEKGCLPLFLAVRFGKAVGMVEGANAPALVALVKEQIPNLTDEE